MVTSSEVSEETIEATVEVERKAKLLARTYETEETTELTLGETMKQGIITSEHSDDTMELTMKRKPNAVPVTEELSSEEISSSEEEEEEQGAPKFLAAPKSTMTTTFGGTIKLTCKVSGKISSQNFQHANSILIFVWKGLEYCQFDRDRKDKKYTKIRCVPDL